MKYERLIWLFRFLCRQYSHIRQKISKLFFHFLFSKLLNRYDIVSFEKKLHWSKYMEYKMGLVFFGCSGLHLVSMWKSLVFSCSKFFLNPTLLLTRNIIDKLCATFLLPSLLLSTTGCARDRDLHKHKYWTPNFLGFFDFVKIIKLLITQKKIKAQAQNHSKGMMPQSKIECFKNNTKKCFIYKSATAY